MKRNRRGKGSTLDEFAEVQTHQDLQGVDRDQFRGALLFAAVGDALGWPTEFIQPGKRATASGLDLPLKDYAGWSKTVGGKWWGYTDQIAPGDYSDDTQLTLSVARSIADSGVFEPESFAYVELPLWLQYERGGGRSIKAAARSLVSRDVEWDGNFYRGTGVDYRMAGANGAAMRNLPIALAADGDLDRMVRESFQNAIITHGHPRAILGAALIGLAVWYALTHPDDVRPAGLIDFLNSELPRTPNRIMKARGAADWVARWGAGSDRGPGGFYDDLTVTTKEALDLLREIPDFLSGMPRDFYIRAGALVPETRGSGIATVICGIFMFLKFHDYPEEGLLDSVNELGSDTDTIAGFMGALLGASQGTAAVPGRFVEGLQDHSYIEATAERLHAIATGQFRGSFAEESLVRKEEGYHKILAWEVGLHEMFWDAISVGGKVVHPALGRGTITGKFTKPVSRPGYSAKILKVAFDTGQTCVFHSRIQAGDRISESLAREVVHEMEASGPPRGK